jgi:hypothetical protein
MIFATMYTATPATMARPAARRRPGSLSMDVGMKTCESRYGRKCRCTFDCARNGPVNLRALFFSFLFFPQQCPLLQNRAGFVLYNWYNFRSFRVVFTSSSPTVAQAMAHVALVIGNGAYEQGAEFVVANAASSALAVGQRLSALGFGVTLVQNAAKEDMQAAFPPFLATLSPGCSAVVYYCGHGWQSDAGGDCLLLPVDFTGADPSGVCSQ